MKRLQVQLDDELYSRLKEEAHMRGTSMASLIREVLKTSLGMRMRGLMNFPFIGAGESKQGELSPVSERHVEALEEAFR